MTPKQTQRPPRSQAEWIAFGVACAVLLAVAGSIAWIWTESDDPPSITAEVVEQRTEGPDTYYTVEIRNDGDETAEAVQVQAEVTAGGESVADGEQIVDFLSGGESEEVVFVFSDVPPDAEMEPRIASFSVP